MTIMKRLDQIIFTIITLVLAVIIGLTGFDNDVIVIALFVIGIISSSIVFVFGLYTKSKFARLIIHIICSILMSFILGDVIQKIFF